MGRSPEVAHLLSLSRLNLKQCDGFSCRRVAQETCMRPFDATRTLRAHRVTRERAALSPAVSRGVLPRSRQGSVNWDIPTVLRRRSPGAR